MSGNALEQEMKKENAYLKSTKRNIQELIETEKIRFKILPKQYKSNPFLLQSMMSLVGTKLNNLETSKQKPYFARIDFKNDLEKNGQTYYIGKIGIISNDNKIVVVDWRAPISTIYYDSNIGNVEYIAPEGKVKGKLDLKRQIVIENGELISIFDVDSVSDDELLKPYLGVNADHRLKNIVSSIQSEQNRIIRADLNKNIIIQGVAGSGKTTVALHRISYLIYNCQDSNNQEKFMVIGPNKFFINYISNVLPDLDVVNAKQWTFEEMAKEYLNEKINIVDNYQNNISDMSSIKNENIYKIKTSMKYKEILNKFIHEYEQSIFENDGIYINDYCIISSNQIKKIYDENMSNTCIIKKVERTCEIISKKVLQNEQIMKEKIKNVFQKKIILASTENEVEKLKRCKFEIYKEINDGYKNVLKKYFACINTRISHIYKSFIENIDKYADSKELYIDIDEYKKKMTKSINKKVFEVEDIPALMYLKYIFYGNTEYKKYIHVVIDEAQDFGEFHFYMLKEILQNSTFSILGDLAQSIYSFRSIDNWNNVVNNIFNEKCELMKLKKSYRTSIEIMNEANKVNEYLGLDKATPVIRHGNSVKVTKIDNYDDEIAYIVEKINEYTKKEYKSIAVICKSMQKTGKICKELKKYISNIELITSDNEKYNGGICALTSFLAKGLEFDCDIIVDVDEDEYNSNNVHDMKLLYVTMTRALHEMELIYTKEITKPLIK